TRGTRKRLRRPARSSPKRRRKVSQRAAKRQFPVDSVPTSLVHSAIHSPCRQGAAGNDGQQRRSPVPIVMFTPLLAAARYSLLYLMMGGGLGGAILIFVVLKALGR